MHLYSPIRFSKIHSILIFSIFNTIMLVHTTTISYLYYSNISVIFSPPVSLLSAFGYYPGKGSLMLSRHSQNKTQTSLFDISDICMHVCIYINLST